jgi:hypothetical protein
VTKEEALERALMLHSCAAGEEATGATERWVEIAEDETRKSPVRDVRCWVVEFSGDNGPTLDLYIGVEDGAVVKRSAY